MGTKTYFLQCGKEIKKQFEEHLAEAVKDENIYNPRPSKMSRTLDGSTIFSWRCPANQNEKYVRGLIETLQANDDRYGIDYAYKMIIISEDSVPEFYMNESGEELFEDLRIGVSLPKECEGKHTHCGYGIDAAEHPDDDFIGLLEFTKKYTPDVYEGIIRDLGPAPDDNSVVRWFDTYHCSGYQTGVFAHVAHVINRVENKDSEDKRCFATCFGGKIFLRNNWIRMSTKKSTWELTNEEFRNIVNKYLSQVTDREYHFDYLNIEGR